MGYLVKELKTANLYGVQQEGFSYSLKYAEDNSELYRGTFPTSNNRNDFYSPEIHITDICSDGSAIYVVLICHCWCKYDYEFPMVSFQVVKIETRVISKDTDEDVKLRLASTRLWGASKKAYTVTSIESYKRDAEESQGDFPNDVAIKHEYSNIPFLRLKFTRNKRLRGSSAFAFPASTGEVFGISIGELGSNRNLDRFIDQCCIKS